jgi:hypothetical protein
MQKRSPFTKDLISSIHPRFHVMIVRGNQTHKTQMRKEAVKNESRVAF